MSTQYLCYDIRGIQSFIFKIARLKHIVGGSALVDRFDRKIVPEIDVGESGALLASGGGKGAFRVEGARGADRIERKLIKLAHGFGLDIRFGRSHDYSEAANCASRLYPYSPDRLDGHPCPDSGLYPVENGKPHYIVSRRKWTRGVNLTRWFEDELSLEQTSVHPELLGQRLAFMRNVDENDEDEDRSGLAGFRSLGERNRWAVICMDGNDMGRQFQAMGSSVRESSAFVAWLRQFSRALDECTKNACRDGIYEVLRRWAGDPHVVGQLGRRELEDGDGEIIVPVRPLVVGGDDITVLCHAAYATAFVRRACERFERYSRELAAEVREKAGIELWPFTKDHVTISAGILYCGTSVPLATAIPYTHDLLSLAKGKGRILRQNLIDDGAPKSIPSPACVDFEGVTESMLDTPHARRMRALTFIDEDVNKRVALTCRPYEVGALGGLEHDLDALKLPRTMLHRLLPGLRQGRSDREIFYARLGKHRGALLDALDETSIGRGASRWRWDGETLRTDIIDMVILAEESHRMSTEAAR